MNLEQFTRAYMAAALWSSTDDAGEPLDANRDETDIAPETAAKMHTDCEAFIAANRESLARYAIVCPGNEQWSSAELAGHDFWLTRNHHGAGFWDRGAGEAGRLLTDAAHMWPEVSLYIGDDGQVYA